MSKSNPIRSNSSQFTVPPPKFKQEQSPFLKATWIPTQFSEAGSSKPNHNHHFSGEKTRCKTSATVAPFGGPSRFASFTRKLGRLPLETNGRNRGIWKALKGGRTRRRASAGWSPQNGIINCPDMARYVITKISTNKKSLNNRAVFFLGGGGIDCMYKLYIWYILIGWCIYFFVSLVAGGYYWNSHVSMEYGCFYSRWVESVQVIDAMQSSRDGCFKLLEDALRGSLILHVLHLFCFTKQIPMSLSWHIGGPSKKNMELSLPQLFLHVLPFLLKGRKW